MKNLLWLDDMRNPITGDWARNYFPNFLGNVFWLKDVDSFKNWIVENGLPDLIGFDHDLGVDNDGKLLPDGYDAAKWLAEYCMDNNKEIPEYFIQSSNTVGAENINSYLRNAKKHMNA